MQFGAPGVPGTVHHGTGHFFPGITMSESGYAFDGVVAIKRESDRNADGKPDRIDYFRRHSIQRIEWDLDFDGEFDLRATYAQPADGVPNLKYQLRQFENGYRLVPSTTTAAYPMHGGVYYADPPPYYEARRDDKWSDSFTLDLSTEHRWHHINGGPSRGVMTFVCEDGAAVSLTTEADPRIGAKYYKTLFNNGKVISTVMGESPDQLTNKTGYTYGEAARITTQTDRDADGDLDYETTQPWANNHTHHAFQPYLAYQTTVRMKIDGEWTGTFIDRGRRYVDGRLIEAYAYRTEEVVQRREYDEHGQLIWAYTDTTGDRKFDLRRKTDGTTHQLVDGEWVGDLVTEFSGAESRSISTYRDGQLVANDARNGKEGWHTVVQYPRPGVEIISSSSWAGASERTQVWNDYATQPRNASYPLLRSAHDFDGDGKPDVFVVYQALTIDETRPEGWAE